MGKHISWYLGGSDGLTLVLSAETTMNYRDLPKVRKEVHSDARIIAVLKGRAITVQGADGAVLATVPALGEEK